MPAVEAQGLGVKRKQFGKRKLCCIPVIPDFQPVRMLLPDAAPAGLLEFFQAAVIPDAKLKIELCEICGHDRPLGDGVRQAIQTMKGVTRETISRRERRCSARRRLNAMMVKVGKAHPPVGKTELPAT